MKVLDRAESLIGRVPIWVRVILGGSLVLVGGFITLVFGFILFAYYCNRIGGGRPTPELLTFSILWLGLGAAPLGAAILLLGTKPPARRLWSRAFLVVLLLFLAAGADGNVGPRSWYALFRREKLPDTNADALRRTTVSPHLEAQLAAGTNVLWCGTFQLAWNEACNLAGADLHFDREDPMVAALNKHNFVRDWIDEPSYVAMAGLVKDNIHDRIQTALKAKFDGSFKPRILPDKALTPRAQDFVAYACLYKLLAFPTPYERLDEALSFGGVKVRAFGFSQSKAPQAELYRQVLILDYQSEDDFVIELKTKSEGDRVILAKVKPKATLSATITQVLARSSPAKAGSPLQNDSMIVPRIHLDLTRRYSELEGRHLTAGATNVATDLLLRTAVQTTQFDMSERGVELKSEAHMAFGCAKEEIPAPKHKMIFDKPFLILLERRNAPMPYFALWLDNPELLIAW